MLGRCDSRKHYTSLKSKDFRGSRVIHSSHRAIAADRVAKGKWGHGSVEDILGSVRNSSTNTNTKWVGWIELSLDPDLGYPHMTPHLRQLCFNIFKKQ